MDLVQTKEGIAPVKDRLMTTLFLAGLFHGIVILGVAAIWLLANPNRHRDFIQKELETRLGRKVSLGDMSLGLLPLRFQVKNVVIAEDPNLGRSESFIEAQNVDIRVRLLPLLSGNIQVDSVELVSPKVELVRTKGGAWNFATLGATGPSAEPAEALAALVAKLRAELTGVRTAMRNRAVIEQAKGVLVERLGITPDQGFDQLVRLSQRTNIKLIEVAAAIVGTTAPDPNASDVVTLIDDELRQHVAKSRGTKHPAATSTANV